VGGQFFNVLANCIDSRADRFNLWLHLLHPLHKFESEHSESEEENDVQQEEYQRDDEPRIYQARGDIIHAKTFTSIVRTPAGGMGRSTDSDPPAVCSFFPFTSNWLPQRPSILRLAWR